MKINKAKLKATIKEISEAIDKYQAKTAMKELARLLGMKSLTSAGRKKALLMLRQLMREEILTHAETHIIANPTLYPAYSEVLLEEIKKLKESYNAPEATESDIMRYLELPDFDAIGEKTIKNIQAFLKHAYSTFADNSELKNDGYKYLRFLSEQEVIFLYISVASSQLELTWHESYVLVLFMASDMAIIDKYPIDAFFFAGEFIEIATPWNISSETNQAKLRQKLKVAFSSFDHMDSQVFLGFVAELGFNLLSTVIKEAVDSLSGKKGLPADISYLIDCLNEVAQPIEDSDGDATYVETDFIETLTTAAEMITFLCTHHDIEYLKNDYFEVKGSLALPIFGEALRMRAHQALTTHIVSFLLERVDVSAVAKCKIRLYLALMLTPGIALCGDYILDWIMGEVADM